MYVAVRIVKWIYLCFPVIVQAGRTPIYLASLCGYDKVVEVLLTAGADVNLPNKVSY